jgi:hypothetical protein
MKIALLIGSLALAVVASTPAATHRARPDLVVTKVAISRTVILAGGSLRATDTTKNVGRRRARGTVTRYFIAGGGIHKLAASRGVRALGAGKSSTGSRFVKTSTSLPAGTYAIQACADATHLVRERSESNDCRLSPEFTVKAPPPPA